MANNYNDMSVGELDAAIQEISVERDSLRDQALTLTKLRDKRAAQDSAAAKLAAMSDVEREALMQHVSVHGIGSTAKMKA